MGLKLHANTSLSYSLQLLLLGILFFLPGLGGVHLFDWDEINFAEISREMIETGDYLQVQIGYQPFWEKPPLFFWLQSVCMNIFGINEFAARLPNALIGIASLQVLFQMGKRLRSPSFGVWWSLAYFGSILPHLYFKSGIIDPLFNLLIFAGFYFFISGNRQISMAKRTKYGALTGLLIGAAVLTKGPVALLFIGLAWLLSFIFINKKYWVSARTIFTGIATGILTIGAWFGVEIAAHGTWFIEQFITYQIRLLSTEDAGHGGFFGYHFVIVLLGCFPMSWFALQNLLKRNDETFNVDNDWRRWMIILLMIVLILFSLVQSKIVHYSSLAYFPLSFLAALAIHKYKDGSLPRWLKIAIGINGIILILACLALPILGARMPELAQHIGSVSDRAAFGQEVDWPLYTFTPFLIFSITLLYFYFGASSERRMKVLFLGTAVWLFVGLWSFIGRIETYSQRPAIEFCKAYGSKGLIQHHGHKSYATLFYAKRAPISPPEGVSHNIWLFGDDDFGQDVFVISKPHMVNDLLKTGRYEELYREGGFVFLRKL